MADDSDGLDDILGAAKAHEAAKAESRRQWEREEARRKRFFDAWWGVSRFVQDGDMTDAEFWEQWEDRVMDLGRVLRTEGLADLLASVPPPGVSETGDRGFRYAVRVFQAAIDGDRETVSRAMSGTFSGSGESYGQAFRATVNGALRREVMDRLRVPALRRMGLVSDLKPARKEPVTKPATPVSGEDLPEVNGTRREQGGRSKPKPPKRDAIPKELSEERAALYDAALREHHGYDEGSVSNSEPIGVRELARKIGRESGASATAYFKWRFISHKNYKHVCGDMGNLAAALKLISGEVQPHALLNRDPTATDGGDDR